ncbi:MAG: outer membrane lipoprotein carrier protein LolA [Ferruginibacter sp.]|nr:outer membrane lipoprotein carrier protein LolA [Cytophagales bacterium]
MRRIIQRLLVVAFSLGVFITQAQTNDPKAGEILEAMSKKYKAIPSFKATFTYTSENKSSGGKESYPGELTVKGNMFRLKMAGQEVINNGTTVWTYIRESNEVNISDSEPEDEEVSPAKIFNIYKKGYRYTFSGETKEKGVAFEEVELIPEKKNGQVSKVRFKVDKKDKSIKSVKLFEKNGNRSTYAITKFAASNIDDKLFAFDESQYKDVEVIDLRDK